MEIPSGVHKQGGAYGRYQEFFHRILAAKGIADHRDSHHSFHWAVFHDVPLGRS